MNLDLTEEQKMIQDTARDFALTELEPVAADLDRGGDRQVFYDNLKKLSELGFMGLNVQDQYGGCEAGGDRLQSGGYRDRQGLRFDRGHGFGQQHGL